MVSLFNIFETFSFTVISNLALGNDFVYSLNVELYYNTNTLSIDKSNIVLNLVYKVLKIALDMVAISQPNITLTEFKNLKLSQFMYSSALSSKVITFIVKHNIKLYENQSIEDFLIFSSSLLGETFSLKSLNKLTK